MSTAREDPPESGDEGSKPDTKTARVMTPKENEALDTKEILQTLQAVLSTKSAEVVIEAFAKSVVAKAEGSNVAAKLEHERKLHAQKWNGIHVTIFLVALVVLIVAMVVFVQLKVLDESTVQKIALVVLALLGATAGRARQG